MSKFVAKLASAQLQAGRAARRAGRRRLDFLHPLPVSALWGVGERTGQVLARLGLRTVGGHRADPGGHAAAGARPGGRRAPGRAGPGPRRAPGVSRVPEKSIGAEETFPSDVDDPELIRRELLRLSGRTARGLRSAGARPGPWWSSSRLANFTTITRSRTLPEPTDVAQTDLRDRLRAVHARPASTPGPAPPGRGARQRPGARRPGAATQLAFGQRAARWRDAERAVDRISRPIRRTDPVRPAAWSGTGPAAARQPRPPGHPIAASWCHVPA